MKSPQSTARDFGDDRRSAVWPAIKVGLAVLATILVFQWVVKAVVMSSLDAATARDIAAAYRKGM